MNGACDGAGDRRTYRVEEIAKMLDIGRASAYRLVKKGLFRTVKVGKSLRISKQSFDEWLDKDEQGDYSDGIY